VEIEQGMFDLCLDKIIDVLTFIALSAVVNALLIGNPLVDDPGLWSFILAVMFTTGTCLFVIIYKKIELKIIQDPEKKVIFNYLIDLTVSNMSQILALFYSSALQGAIMENIGLTGSAVAIAWIFFLIMFSICFVIVFWKDRKARILESRKSCLTSGANFQDEKGKFREAAKKIRYEITIGFVQSTRC
jgi:cbb3-type cytochrome oxidase subunit 3